MPSVNTTGPSSPPSLPPTVTPPRTETNKSSKHVSALLSSPAQSVWTAPTRKRSSTKRSPPQDDLAPTLTFQTPSTGPLPSARDGLSDVNTYYTASWGSPHHTASRDAVLDYSARLVAEQLRESPLDSRDPASSPPFGLDYLLPLRNRVTSVETPSFGLEHLIPSRIRSQQRTSNPFSSDGSAVQSDQAPNLLQPRVTPTRHQVTRSLTEDWVDRYSSARWDPEREGWAGDESGDSDTVSEKSEDFKTPIPFTWFSGRHRRRNSASADGSTLTKAGFERLIRGHTARSGAASGYHKTRGSDPTLKPEDFARAVRTAHPRPEDDMSIFESRWAEEPLKEAQNEDDKENVDQSQDAQSIRSQTSSTPLGVRPSKPIQKPDQGDLSQAEKPLPLPPSSEAETDVEDSTAQVLVSPSPGIALASPPPKAAKDLEPTQFPERSRTKLLWKGKACWISLPSQGPEFFGRPRPLTTAEIGSRLESFEQAGYNIHGFDIDHTWSDSAVSQGRDLYPDPAEDAVQRQKKMFQVRVPNPRFWKEYMDQQLEAKLAALGVSSGDVPVSNSPAMSQQSSGQFGSRNFSPNMMTASMVGGSNRSTPSLAHYSTAGHSHAASVASPLSFSGAPGHMHRHSTFGGMPFGFPQQPNAYGGLPAFSPSQHFNMDDVVSGRSPSADRYRSVSAGPIKSPLSSYRGLSPLGVPKPELDTVPEHLRHQSVYSSFSPAFPYPSVTPTPKAAHALPDLREDDEDQPQGQFASVASGSPQTEMIHPSPRGRSHRHNISEGLENDVREAESRLQTSFERAMNESDSQVQQAYVPPAKRASGTTNGLTSVASDGSMPRSISGHSTDGAADLATALPLQNKLFTKTRGHVSKLSVAAPEFKFSPGGFQPTFPGSAVSPYDRSRIPSSENMQASAPPFQPTGFGGFGGAAVPNASFEFSSSFSQMPLVQPAPLYQLPTIFGNVSIPDIEKPARRSKAITIKAPTASLQSEKEERHDENGCPVQSDERQKRARKDRADGDSEPLFAAAPDSSEPQGSPSKLVSEELMRGPDDDDAKESPMVREADKVLSTEQMSSDEKAIEPLSQHEHEREPSSQQGHTKNDSSLSALAKPFEFNPGSASTFTPSQPVAAPGQGALDGKPDLSPARVFSRDITFQHQNVESLSYNTSPEPQKLSPYLQQKPHFEPYPRPQQQVVMPSFDEIDAVMQQLNNESEDQSPTFPSELIREGTPELETSVIRLSPMKRARSNAPSPAPMPSQFTRHVGPRNSYHVEQEEISSQASAVRLDRADEIPMSDWSVDLDIDEETVHTRSRFFDDRIDSIVGNILQNRLQPLEKSLRLIHRAVSSKTVRDRSRPATARTTSAVDSDADDEDEPPSELPGFRPLSSGNDKRAQQVKAAVLEALAIQEANSAHKIPSTPGPSAAVDIHHALLDMKTTIARIAAANIDIDDVKAVVEDALNSHSRALIPAEPVSQDVEIERRHKRAITELEGRFNETLAGKLEEANQRLMIEEREAEGRRLLRLAEEELSLLRATTGDQEDRIHSLQREFQLSLDRAEEAENARRKAEAEKDELKKQLSDAEAETSAFESTLEEYRISSDKWRQDIDDLTNKNDNLKGVVTELKAQIADGLNIRETMRGKFDKISMDMAAATEQLANEKSTWQGRNVDLQKKAIILQARLEGEVSVRGSLEEEVQSLRAQVHEGMASKIQLEQALRSNAAQEDTLSTLKASLAAEQTLVSRLERDLHEARESGRAEVQRTQMIMQTNIEAANSQADLIRSRLEHELHLAKNAMDDLKMSADTAKARHELLLEEEADLRRDALRKVNESSSASLNDLRERHEESLSYMRVQHEKELANAYQDRQRGEAYLQDRLGLSNDQIALLQDKIAYLEERLEVAQSAAKAAAKQAQAAKSASPVQSRATAEVQFARSAMPEKISPQALRESILVLQEQLQERESKIEALQAEISALDTTAPAKLKERDTEITWLRELLAVRNEDLSELIRQLEQEGFDRQAVRDYAIRIRAGIQMEQAEKERLIQAGTSKTALTVASLVNVATPSAVRLASAWGQWRKGRSDLTSDPQDTPVAAAKPRAAGTITSRAFGKAPSSAAAIRAVQAQNRSRPTSRGSENSAASATPSKPAAGGGAMAGFGSSFAGLMTPPASSLRLSPSPIVPGDDATPNASTAAGGVKQGKRGLGYQDGTVHPGFSHETPPGFGPPRGSQRGTSPARAHMYTDAAGDTDDEEDPELDASGLLGGGDYDSDAEMGASAMEVIGDEDGVAEETLGRSLAAELGAA